MNILLLGPPGHGKALLEIRITESSQVTRVIYHKKLQKTKRALSFIGLSQNWKRANICLFDAPGIVLGCDMVDKMLNGVREDYTPEDWSKNLLEKANDVDTIDYVIVVLSALDLEGNSGWIFVLFSGR